MVAFSGAPGQNVRVIELTEPQVWTLIAVFGASMFAMMGVTTGLFTRVLRAEISGVHGEIGSVRGEIGGLRAEMNARFERVDAQFALVESRLEHLDRDVHALTKRVFNHPE